MSRLSLAEQLAAHHRDKTLAEIVNQSGWDRHVVMHVVLLYGMGNPRFSANDIRDLLPEQGHGYIGAAINGLRVAGIIARVWGEEVPSTLQSTKGHGLRVWTLTDRGHRIAAGRYHHDGEAAA